MKVYLDGKVVASYDEDFINSLNDVNLQQIKAMEERMREGFDMPEGRVSNPSVEERGSYVARWLYQGIWEEDSNVIAPSMAWFAINMPELDSIKMKHESGSINISLSTDIVSH